MPMLLNLLSQAFHRTTALWLLKYQCYFVLAACKACQLCQQCTVPHTHLPRYVNKVNHKPQQATCQLLQPRLGAEPTQCWASIKLSITNWQSMQHQLKHYTKYKHINLIRWLYLILMSSQKQFSQGLKQ